MKRAKLIASAGLIAALAAVGAYDLQAQDRAAEKIISANERASVDALINKNLAAFTALISPEGRALSESGVSPMSEFVKNFDEMMKATKQGTVSITDESFQWIDATTVIHTFKQTSKGGTFDGKSMAGSAWASTVWVKKGEKWMGMFHQSSRTPAPAAK
jgi:hypothetical protein